MWFLPDFPTTLQLILPFGWAAHNPAISYFFAVLHILFFSINLCVIPCMSEIFLKSRIPAVHTFPLTFYLIEYIHCYGKGIYHFSFGIWGFSHQIPVPWKWFFLDNRETGTSTKAICRRLHNVCTARYRLAPNLLTLPSNALVFRHEVEKKVT